jgi:hypothetical protein
MPHIQQVALHLDKLYTAYVTSFFTLITTKLPPTQPQLKVIIVAY